MTPKGNRVKVDSATCNAGHPHFPKQILSCLGIRKVSILRVEGELARKRALYTRLEEGDMPLCLRLDTGVVHLEVGPG